ncbi:MULTISPECIES: hypothetical protein [unclassified Sporosarcina]|uniref:hypothetical protein n=1 Tax=unclassified Sporosarcina TaxID=2647733 RepID=UPI000B17BC57|nr:hypothetical protein [Sporosarcina sp. ZBG7A]
MKKITGAKKYDKEGEQGMSKNVILAIAGMIVGWLIISFFTKSFDMQYIIVALFGFLLGYIVKKEEKED